MTSTATTSAAIESALAYPALTKMRPISTANEPARSEPKCSALAARATDAVPARRAQAHERAGRVDGDDDDEGRDDPPVHVDLVRSVAREATQRLEADEGRDEREKRALPQRSQVLGLPVAVLVLLVGRAHRDTDREERQERRDEIGPGVCSLGQQAQRTGYEAGDELDRHEEDRGEHGEGGGADLCPCGLGLRLVG